MISMEIEHSPSLIKQPKTKVPLKKKTKRKAKILRGKPAKIKKLIASGKYVIDDDALAQKILEKGNVL